MHSELKRMFFRFDFPTFPKKYVITSPSTVDERRFILDYYLKMVFKVRVIQQSDIVQKFLKPDANDACPPPTVGIPIGNGTMHSTQAPVNVQPTMNGIQNGHRVNGVPSASVEDQNNAIKQRKEQQDILQKTAAAYGGGGL